MRDPYSVLGINRGADADEIKKAYRKLSRKYHPDSNINNPNKDLAEEKFKEVQEAYECIMYEREHGPGTYGDNSDSSYNDGYEQSAGYGDYNRGYSGGYNREYRNRQSSYTGADDSPRMKVIITYINRGQYEDALNILEGMKTHERTAKWYFLRAHVNEGMGNIINALDDAKRAMSMEPDNLEYSDYYMQLLNAGRMYSNMGMSHGRRMSPTSDCCTWLICGDLICNGICCGIRHCH